MGKIKEQLAGVAALIGVLAAIGGGFVKYGEITTKLDALESANVKDFSAEIAVLQEQVNKLADEINVSLVKEQVELGVAVRMACLKLYCK